MRNRPPWPYLRNTGLANIASSSTACARALARSVNCVSDDSVAAEGAEEVEEAEEGADEEEDEEE